MSFSSTATPTPSSSGCLVSCTNNHCKINVFGSPDAKLMRMPVLSSIAWVPPTGGGISGSGKGRPFPPVNG